MAPGTTRERVEERVLSFRSIEYRDTETGRGGWKNHARGAEKKSLRFPRRVLTRVSRLFRTLILRIVLERIRIVIIEILAVVHASP